MTLSLTSPAFDNGQRIPTRYTCEGYRDMNPEFRVDSVPPNAKSLVLLMDDPDVPKEVRPDGVFDHWVLFNIPPQTKVIPEGSVLGVVGANSRGENAYTGPCPPIQYIPNEHRYFFKLYALDTMLDLPDGASTADVQKAMQGHLIQHTQLMGKYKMQNA